MRGAGLRRAAPAAIPPGLRDGVRGRGDINGEAIIYYAQHTGKHVRSTRGSPMRVVKKCVAR